VREHSHINTASNSIDKIPIRSTVLSALAMVPYTFILLAFSSSNMTKTHIGLTSKIILQLQVTFRCPLAALMAFKYNKKPQLDIQANLRTLRLNHEDQNISSSI
jgi:hypothetical protein